MEKSQTLQKFTWWPVVTVVWFFTHLSQGCPWPFTLCDVNAFLAFFSLFCIFWVNWTIFRSSTEEKKCPRTSHSQNPMRLCPNIVRFPNPLLAQSWWSHNYWNTPCDLWIVPEEKGEIDIFVLTFLLQEVSHKMQINYEGDGGEVNKHEA